MSDGPLTTLPSWALAEMIKAVQDASVGAVPDPVNPEERVTYCFICDTVEGHAERCFLRVAEEAYERNSTR